MDGLIRRNNKYKIEKSDKEKFLWKVSTPEEKEIYFGDPKVKNYTGSKDGSIRYQFVRSRPNYWDEDSKNTKEFWERWILYNKKNLEASVEDTCKRFDMNIEYPNKKERFQTIPKNFKFFFERADKKLTQEILAM